MTVTSPGDPPDSTLLDRAGDRAVWWGGLALAGVAFLAAGARAVGSGEETAEIRHLAVLGLLSLAALLPTAFGSLRTTGAALALAFALAIWVLPQGLLRSGTGGLILAAGWLLAATSGRGGRELAPARLVGLALALQVLQRGEVLVTEGGLKAVFIVLALPIVFGASIALLETRYGRAAPLAGLLALSASGEITTAAALTAAAAAATAWEWKTGAWATALGIGLLAIAWSPPIGVLALLGALYLLRAPRWAAALFVAAGLLLAVAPARAWDLPRELTVLLLCAPFLWLGSAVGRARPGPLAASLALALVGLRFLDTHEALIAPMLVLGLVGADLVDGLWRRAQVSWTLALVGLGALLANYPWHRDTDLGTLLAGGTWPLAVALAAALVVAPRQPSIRLAALAAALVTLAAFPIVQPRTVLLDWPPVTLSSSAPVWRVELPDELGAGRVRVLVDSRLAEAEALEAGARCATLELLGADGGTLRSWPLRAGLETAEWSADRSGAPRPDSFSSAVAATGDFFGRRYRAVLEAPVPDGAQALRLTVDEARIGDARLELHHVALERPLRRHAP